MLVGFAIYSNTPYSSKVEPSSLNVSSGGNLNVIPNSVFSESELNSQRIVYWNHIHGLGIDPNDSNIMYIATHGELYKSEDGSPPVKVENSERRDYMAFTADPSKSGMLYASGHPSTGGNTGFIRSSDGGVTWQKVSDVLNPPVDFHAIAISSSDPNRLYGFDSEGRGLFKTTDAGSTWTNMTEPPSYISSLAIDPRNSDNIFAGTEKGIFISTDGAHTWTQLNEFKGLAVHALAYSNNGTLFAYGDFIRFAKSNDNGQSWTKGTLNNLSDTVTNIVMDKDLQTIYLSGYSEQGFLSVYKSIDSGLSWKLIGTNRDLSIK